MGGKRVGKTHVDFVRLHFISGGRAGAVGFFHFSHGVQAATCTGNKFSTQQRQSIKWEKMELLHRRRRHETADDIETTVPGNW